MGYAHVTNGTIDQEVGQLPGAGVRQDTGQSVSGLPVASSAVQQACGWYVVVNAARPADTSTLTSDRSLAFANSTVTETWTQRNKTQAELDADTASTNGTTLRSQASSALAGNRTYLAIATPTNAQVIAQVRALTQQVQGLIRLVVNQLDATN